ncbi:MAG: Ig-like domain-containing protein [Bacteroidales bacterium]
MKKILITLVLILMASVSAEAIKMEDIKVYINPGHGGYDSDDRHQHIYPFESGDTASFWESKSNLYKGLHMYYILDSLNCESMLSRVTNTTDDDRSLSGIAVEANNFGADMFFSIHSNAGESVNYPLMLYREDAVGTPRYEGNVTISNILWETLHSSDVSVWTRDTPYVSGDLTFYPQWGTSGLGVLRYLYTVGLLSEGGMHEHRPEAHRLMNDDFWWLEAWHFVRATMEYFDTEDRFVTGNVAGVVYDDHNLREMIMPWSSTAYGRDKLAPINGAYVELKDLNGNVIQMRTTDNMYNGVYVFRNVTPGDYVVEVSEDKYHSYKTNVTVVANEVVYSEVGMTMVRDESLEVISYSPNVDLTEEVSAVTPIVFDFNYDVDVESFEKAFSISPEVEGDIVYSNSYSTVTFTPLISFDPSVTYTVTLTTDVKHPDSNNAAANMQSPIEFSFTTANRSRLELIQSYPSVDGVVDIRTPSLEFRFDKTLNAVGINSNVTIYDSNGNQKSTNSRSTTSNKLTNGYGSVSVTLSADLEDGDDYKVVLSSTIADTDGIPLGEDVTINFTAIDQGVLDGSMEVLEDFEADQLFTPNTDESIGVTGDFRYLRSSAKYLFGTYSSMFLYEYDNYKECSAIWDYNGDYKQIDNGDCVGLYVYGDLNNHELYLGFTAGTDTKYEKVCNTNFLGWKYVEITLSSLESGVAYNLTNVKLAQTEAIYTMEGSFQLDNLVINRTSGVGAAPVISDLSIYPITATTVIDVSAADEILKLQLINPAGSVVKSANGTQIVVSDMEDGVYILKITTDKGTVSSKVIVKK